VEGISSIVFIFSQNGGRAFFRKALISTGELCFFGCGRVRHFFIFKTKWRKKNEEDRFPAAGSGYDAGSGSLRRIQAR
jgi:hypothetical protein